MPQLLTSNSNDYMGALAKFDARNPTGSCAARRRFIRKRMSPEPTFADIAAYAHALGAREMARNAKEDESTITTYARGHRRVLQDDELAHSLLPGDIAMIRVLEYGQCRFDDEDDDDVLVFSLGSCLVIFDEEGDTPCVSLVDRAIQQVVSRVMDQTARFKAVIERLENPLDQEARDLMPSDGAHNQLVVKWLKAYM